MWSIVYRRCCRTSGATRPKRDPASWARTLTRAWSLCMQTRRGRDRLGGGCAPLHRRGRAVRDSPAYRDRHKAQGVGGHDHGQGHRLDTSGMPAYAKNGKVVCSFPEHARVQQKVRDAWLPARGEPRRSWYVAGRLCAESADRCRRGNPQRVRTPELRSGISAFTASTLHLAPAYQDQEAGQDQPQERKAHTHRKRPGGIGKPDLVPPLWHEKGSIGIVGAI